MSATILIVEDNPDDVLFLRRAFDATGIPAAVSAVHDGAGAIDYLMGQGKYADRQKHPFPGVMILDLNMPVASGFVVLRWLREQPVLKRLPVVVLSSSAEEEDVNLAYDLGVSSYIVKPSGLKALDDVARQVASYWLSLNQRPVIQS